MERTTGAALAQMELEQKPWVFSMTPSIELGRKYAYPQSHEQRPSLQDLGNSSYQTDLEKPATEEKRQLAEIVLSNLLFFVGHP